MLVLRCNRHSKRAVCNFVHTVPSLQECKKTTTKENGHSMKFNVTGIQTNTTDQMDGQNKIEAKRLRNKTYYERHKERLNQKKRQYYQENKDKVWQTMKEYKTKNKERIAQLARDYYALNKGELASYIKQYNEEEKQEMRNYVKDNANQLREDFGILFNIQSPSDWYNKTYKERISHASSKNVFSKITLPEFLSIVYPEEKWIYGKFKTSPKNTWRDPKKLRDFLISLEPSLFVKEPTDWYRVSLEQLRKVGGNSIVTAYRSLYEIVSTAFPEVSWDFKKFSYRGKKSMQRWLVEVIKATYEDQTAIYENYDHPSLHWEGTQKKNMELDIWIPERSLAFEYQGEQHYHNLASIFGNQHNLLLYSDRDRAKSEACAKEGIALVSVPYWWDGSATSLAALLELHRGAL